MKPSLSDVLSRPLNQTIIGPFIAAPCRAKTTGAGFFGSYPPTEGHARLIEAPGICRSPSFGSVSTPRYFSWQASHAAVYTHHGGVPSSPIAGGDPATRRHPKGGTWSEGTG